MPLDFKNTCNDIDENANSLRAHVDERITELIEEICPKIDSEEKERIVNEKTTEIMEEFDNRFEKVRDLNKEMRYVADEQINELETEIGKKDSEINLLKVYGSDEKQ